MLRAILSQCLARGGVAALAWVLLTTPSLLGSEPMAAVLWGRAHTGLGYLDFQHWRGTVLGGDIVDLAFASKRVVMLKANGTLATFGLTGAPENTLPYGLSNIVEIESTWNLGYALDRTGTLWPLNSPALPSLPRSTTIRCGWNILVGITLNGGVFYTDRLGSLVSVPGVSDAVAIAAGDEFGAALQEDGSVTVFGNFPGTIPTGIRNAARIRAGPNHLVVIHTDGSVTAYGKADTKLLKVPDALRDPVEIVLGTGHAVALQRDGTILCWGDNEAGQCRPPPGLSNVVSIATAYTHCMAATADGAVVTWGLLWLEDISAPPRVEGGVTRVMSGHEFLVAMGPPTTPVLLKSPTNVTVFPWQSARFEAAARGLGHTFEWRWNGRLLPESDSPVLEFAGTDVGLGPSEYGRFSVTVRGPDGSAVTSPEVSLTVQPDSQPGTILEWRKSDLPATPVDPEIQGHALRIAADDQTRATILDDGSLQLDPSDRPSRRIPGSSSGRPESVALCGSFVRVVTRDHRVREFYRDGTERIGIPTELYENVLRVAPGPGPITVLKTDGSVWTLDPEQNVVQLSKGPARDVAVGGRGFTVVALADGTVTVISPPADLIPPSLGGVVAVAAGQDHAVALLEDGTVAAWGGNGGGQCDVPLGIGRISAITAGQFHTAALQVDGRIVAWGRLAAPRQTVEFSEPLTIPAGLDHVTQLASGGGTLAAIIGRSRVPRLSLERSGGTLHAIWPDNGIPFHLEASANANGSDWAEVRGDERASDLWHEQSLETSSPAGYFRLVSP